MQQRVLISVKEASEILCLGKTSVYARIKSGDLKIAKMGRSTRVTLASVIEYAIRSVKEGNGSGQFSEIFGEAVQVQTWMGRVMATDALCNNHSKPSEIHEIAVSMVQSVSAEPTESRSFEKNLGGKI